MARSYKRKGCDLAPASSEPFKMWMEFSCSDQVAPLTHLRLPEEPVQLVLIYSISGLISIAGHRIRAKDLQLTEAKRSFKVELIVPTCKAACPSSCCCTSSTVNASQTRTGGQHLEVHFRWKCGSFEVCKVSGCGAACHRQRSKTTVQSPDPTSERAD